MIEKKFMPVNFFFLYITLTILKFPTQNAHKHFTIFLKDLIQNAHKIFTSFQLQNLTQSGKMRFHPKRKIEISPKEDFKKPL
jgi:hypothetical protein